MVRHRVRPDPAGFVESFYEFFSFDFHLGVVPTTMGTTMGTSGVLSTAAGREEGEGIGVYGQCAQRRSVGDSISATKTSQSSFVTSQKESYGSSSRWNFINC